MYDSLQVWQRELLIRAEEVWKAGEGELKFTVYKRPPETERLWKIEGGTIKRGKEERNGKE